MKLLKLVYKERGGVTIFVVLIMALVLFGFTALAVDAGFLYAEKRGMVIAADAAAFAGGKIMKEKLGAEIKQGDIDKAIEVAEDIALKNGVKKRNDIDAKITDYDGKKVIYVSVFNNKKNIFANFLGISDTDVAAEAIATWGFVKKFEGGNMIPLFLFDVEYDMYKNSDIVPLHYGKIPIKGKTSDANRGFIRLFENSSIEKIMQVLQAGKTAANLELNQWIDNLTGNSPQPVIDAIENRLKTAKTLPDEEARREYMRGLVPIMSEKDTIVHNKNKLTLSIVKFAVFEIDDVITEQGVDAENDNQEDTKSKGSHEILSGLQKDYEKITIWDSKEEKYIEHHMEKSTIIGHFTGKEITLREVVTDKDQNTDGITEYTPKYVRLIK